MMNLSGVWRRGKLWIAALLLFTLPVAAQTDDTCTDIVQEALALAGEACGRLGRNEVCYANVQVDASSTSGAQLEAFTTVGDRVDVTQVQSLRTAALDAAANIWGIAVLSLQGNIPNTLPGENVTFVVYGTTEITAESGTEGFDSPMQSFRLQTNIGQVGCEEAPQDGVLVQAPTGVTVNFMINGVEVEVGSTAYLHVDNDIFEVNTFDGTVRITAEGESQTVEPGFHARVCPGKPPSKPVTYFYDEVRTAPVDLLPEPVDIPLPPDDLLDLVFVIDTTGSMDDDIAEVKRNALDVINRLSSSGMDWRIGLVTYRDHPGEADYVTRRETDFTTDSGEIIDAINGVSVGSGGDLPEAVFSGLMEAIGMEWRPAARKIIILMGDAPPHDPEPFTGYTAQSVLDATFTSADSIFPIVIEDNNITRFALQEMADGSSGRLFYASGSERVVETVYETLEAVISTHLKVGQPTQVAGLDIQMPLYIEPSLDASIITNLPRSTTAEVICGPELAEGFIWWQIRLPDGVEGWIQEQTYGEPALIPHDTENPLTEVTCILTTLQGVNIRSGPGTEYEQIASRQTGFTLGGSGQTIGSDGITWWRLLDGFWIHSHLVSEQGDCNNLPVVQP